MSSPVSSSIDQLWSLFGDRGTLLAELPVDAVMARASSGELRATTPRLLELAIAGDHEGVELHTILVTVEPIVGTAEREEREALMATFDTWWRTTLMFDDGPHQANAVLGALAQLDEPLVRWLEPWLVDLDGPPARHLSQMVLAGLDGPAWDAVPDKRDQVLAWASTEPVVFGLTLVGGVHLDPGQLSDTLDRLV